ncbi:family 1 glycosylhydrolase [Glacieibacterium sp.]|uniref:family 1 glycosylhydrolase n=1 Tax=Glacieibacterium sp. TaxID=2860237 RepID=UPI003AFF86EA
MDQSTRLALWGGHECTVNRVGNTYADQTFRTGHQHRLDDLARFAELGVETLRYPVLWERTAPDTPDQRDFSWADERLNKIRRLGINPIVGLIHHGSGPVYTDLLDPSFATGLADHARAVAERYPWVTDWTPVNEPLTTARFSCRYGLWYPHRENETDFWAALLNQIDATRLAMREIRMIVPGARLIQTEDLGFAHSTPQMAEQARFENDRRWMTWDLLEGMVVPGHALWDRLVAHGFEARLRVISADPCPADVLGINTYLCSERFLDHRVSRHPGRLGGDGARCANLDAVRTVEQTLGVETLLTQAWDRYRRPLAITECHNASAREEQLRWFAEVWQAAEAARGQGVDVIAVTAWALLGAYDWNHLLTQQHGHYECGIYDVRSGSPRPTAMVPLLRRLAAGEPVDDVALVQKGWWHRSDRFLHGYGGHWRAAARPTGRPILITGRTGTLGQAFAGICELRGLTHILTGRDVVDLADIATLGPALDVIEPWAVINCAGVVSLDDAELRPELATRVNATGAGLLAEACAARGIAMVQLSSDQVFDGSLGRHYTEGDRPNALNTYGRSKAQAEALVMTAHPSAMIVRTAAFFSPNDRADFAVDVLAALRSGRRIRAAHDEHVSPTFVPDLVDNILDLLLDRASGIWHLVNEGGMSWADFARTLAVANGLDVRLVDAVPGVELGRAAGRPRDVRLATVRGQLMPTLESAIGRFTHGYRPPVCDEHSPFAIAAE